MNHNFNQIDLKTLSNMVNDGIYSKWIIQGIEGYVFGSDKKLYRLPFHKNKKHYALREIKMQYPNRYRINGEWWSVNQLRSKIKLNPDPINLFTLKNSECPF